MTSTNKKKRKRIKRKNPEPVFVNVAKENNRILPWHVHDAYTDLMYVYNEEIDVSNYIKTIDYDKDYDCLLVNTQTAGNICYRFTKFYNKKNYNIFVPGDSNYYKKQNNIKTDNICTSITEGLKQIKDNPSEKNPIQKTVTETYSINNRKMVKEISNTEVIKFRGVPIGGDSKSFVKLLKKKFGFGNFDFKETTVELYGGQFVGEDVNLTVYYSHKSKTVYAVDIYFSDLSYEDEFVHYKSLYTQKYGTPKIIKDNHRNKAVFEIDGGRIIIYGNFNIMYVNTINEKLAQKEHDLSLLDEI